MFRRKRRREAPRERNGKAARVKGERSHGRRWLLTERVRKVWCGSGLRRRGGEVRHSESTSPYQGRRATNPAAVVEIIGHNLIGDSEICK